MKTLICRGQSFGPYQTIARIKNGWLCDATVFFDTVAGDDAYVAEWVEQAPPPPTLAAFEKALTDHLDKTAQARRYDNRITCAVRAGFAGPFQAEGTAFALWMDECNALAYQWLTEVEAGTRPPFATTDEMIAALPPMVWPGD